MLQNGKFELLFHPGHTVYYVVAFSYPSSPTLLEEQAEGSVLILMPSSLQLIFLVYLFNIHLLDT